MTELQTRTEVVLSAMCRNNLDREGLYQLILDHRAEQRELERCNYLSMLADFREKLNAALTMLRKFTAQVKEQEN